MAHVVVSSDHLLAEGEQEVADAIIAARAPLLELLDEWFAWWHSQSRQGSLAYRTITVLGSKKGNGASPSAPPSSLFDCPSCGASYVAVSFQRNYWACPCCYSAGRFRSGRMARLEKRIPADVSEEAA